MTSISSTSVCSYHTIKSQICNIFSWVKTGVAQVAGIEIGGVDIGKKYCYEDGKEKKIIKLGMSRYIDDKLRFLSITGS